MIRILLLLLLLTPFPALADLDEALSAFDRGDFGQAYALYRQEAEQGSPQAQYALGLLYHDGKGVAKDLQASLKWMKKAAESGLIDAQLFVGNLYFDGEGVGQDYQAAIRWYMMAARKGNVDAEYDVAMMFESGLGVPIDCDRAEQWYTKAANQGDEESQEILEYFTCREYANVASLNAPRLGGGFLSVRPMRGEGNRLGLEQFVFGG